MTKQEFMDHLDSVVFHTVYYHEQDEYKLLYNFDDEDDLKAILLMELGDVKYKINFEMYDGKICSYHGDDTWVPIDEPVDLAIVLWYDTLQKLQNAITLADGLGNEELPIVR